MHQISHAGNFSAWQRVARDCLARELPPEACAFRDTASLQPSLFSEPPDAGASSGRVRVPRSFFKLAERVAVHQDPLRWDLLYRLLWRLTHQESRLLEDLFDPDMVRAQNYYRAVSRDIHKVHAFVRFREVIEDDRSIWVAWYNPDHACLALAAPHFVSRFGNMIWSILTPSASAHWDGETLTFGPGSPQRDAPDHDALKALWRLYYRSIFNPARLKIKAMKQEMPRRFWRSLPESTEIDELIRGAHQAVQKDAKSRGRAVHIAPLPESLSGLRAQLKTCDVCDFCAQTTGVVPGEGSQTARVVLVGEQPGDQEDLSGRPFVGPAGKLLHEALTVSGLARDTLYLTNAVKHFKYTMRGTRRIHQRPSPQDIGTCRPWLVQELKLVRPEIVVALGLSAALSVLGKKVRLSESRGLIVSTPLCTQTLVTEHPSAILRADLSERDEKFSALVRDLKKVSALLSGSKQLMP